jgi:hypothetical protein
LALPPDERVSTMVKGDLLDTLIRLALVKHTHCRARRPTHISLRLAQGEQDAARRESLVLLTRWMEGVGEGISEDMGEDEGKKEGEDDEVKEKTEEDKTMEEQENIIMEVKLAEEKEGDQTATMTLKIKLLCLYGRTLASVRAHLSCIKMSWCQVCGARQPGIVRTGGDGGDEGAGTVGRGNRKSALVYMVRHTPHICAHAHACTRTRVHTYT